MTYLLHISIILFLTKLGGLISRRLNQPQVLGGLIVGLLVGPSLLNWIPDTETIDELAEIGVIALMFIAGLETDILQFKKSLNSSFIIAMGGVALPLLLGFLASEYFNVGSINNNVFIGVVLTATSVSISVKTLEELGKLQTKIGYAILAAAIIDDVIGILVFSFVISVSTGSGSIILAILKIVLFLIFALFVGKFWGTTFNNYCIKIGDKQRIAIFAFAFSILIAFISEKYFGVSAITGAYIAGISLSQSKSKDYILSKVNILSYMFLTPIFFVSIGLKSVVTPSLPWLFIIVLTTAAVLGKVLGCGIPARFLGFDSLESLQVGVGMVSRGEVALIVADLGLQASLLSNATFSSLIIVIILSTIITPFLLKLSFSHKSEASKMTA